MVLRAMRLLLFSSAMAGSGGALLNGVFQELHGMNAQSLPVPFDGRPVNGTVQLFGHGAFFRMVDPVFQPQRFQQGENTRVLDGCFSFLKNGYKGLAHDKREYCAMEGIGDDAEGFLEGLQEFIRIRGDGIFFRDAAIKNNIRNKSVNRP